MLDPRMACSEEEFPSGLHVQLVVPRLGTILRAGRFDGLCAAAGLGQRCAVGMSVSVSKLVAACAAAEAEGAAAGGAAGGAARRSSELEVLVCESREGLREASLRVVGELWGCGVKADVAHGTGSEQLAAISYDDVYHRAGVWLSDPRGAVWAYLLVHRHSALREFLLARADLDVWLVPLLRQLYVLSEPPPRQAQADDAAGPAGSAQAAARDAASSGDVPTQALPS